MRLARPLVDRDGLLVAGAGTQLGPSVLRTLRRLAVRSVLVMEEAGDVPSWGKVRPLDEELAALEARLAPARRQGALAELHAAIVRHLGARAARLAEDA